MAGFQLPTGVILLRHDSGWQSARAQWFQLQRGSSEAHAGLVFMKSQANLNDIR